MNERPSARRNRLMAAAKDIVYLYIILCPTNGLRHAAEYEEIIIEHRAYTYQNNMLYMATYIYNIYVRLWKIYLNILFIGRYYTS